MSIPEITNFLLWKSIKKKRSPLPLATTPIKEESMQNKHELIDCETICRVCMNPADIPLNEILFSDTVIISALRAVANLNMHETDFYPKCICSNCKDELKIAYQFKKRCEDSDMMFRKIMPSESLISTRSTFKVKHDFSLILHQMRQRRLELQKNEKDMADIAIKTEDEVPLSDNDYVGIDNSSENEALSNFVYKPKRAKKNSKYKFNKKDIRKPKFKIRLKTKKREDNLQLGNVKSDIVNYALEYPDTEIKSKVRIKKELTIKKLPECKPCALKFDTKEKYEMHRRKNNCKYHPCPQCGKLVMNLLNHEKIMHVRSHKYTCDQCGKVFNSSSALCNHLHIHKNIMKYSCDLCPYKAKRKSYLVCHMRVHTGEKRYLCAQCPAKFSNPSNLRKHQLVHANKMFECNKCSKTFREQRVLKAHFDSAHLNIRYRCSICGKDLCSRKKLLNHELKVHKREKHKLFQNEQKVVVSIDK